MTPASRATAKRPMLVALLWVLGASGCFVPRSGLAGEAPRDDAGPTVPAVEDASVMDAAIGEAGVDAAVPDAGPPDAGPPDAGLPDAGPPFCDPSDPALRLCLRCEGEVRDESASAQPLTATGVAFVPFAVGRGCALDASSRIVVPHAASLDATQLTLEAFVSFDSLPTGGDRMGIADKNGAFGVFVYAGGELRCTSGGSAVQVDGAFTTGHAHHVACVFDGASARAYVDGVAVNEVSAGPAGTTGETLHVGSNSPDGASALLGTIDEVRLFAAARSASEIAAAAARR